MKWGITCFFERVEEFALVGEVLPEYPLSHVELRGEQPFFAPECTTERDIRFIRDTIEKAGLSASVHATFYDINLATINDDLNAAMLNSYRRYLEMTEAVGARVLVVHGGLLHRDAASLPTLLNRANQRLMDNLRRLGDEAARRGISIGLENSPPNPNRLMIPGWREHLETLCRVNHPHVKAVLDTAHAFLQGLDIYRYYNEISEWLVEMHVHNNDGKSDLHSAMGAGHIDYRNFFSRVDVRVPVVMEIRSLEEARVSLEWVARMAEHRSASR